MTANFAPRARSDHVGVPKVALAANAPKEELVLQAFFSYLLGNATDTGGNKPGNVAARSWGFDSPSDDLLQCCQECKRRDF